MAEQNHRHLSYLSEMSFPRARRTPFPRSPGGLSKARCWGSPAAAPKSTEAWINREGCLPFREACPCASSFRSLPGKEAMGNPTQRVSRACSGFSLEF